MNLKIDGKDITTLSDDQLGATLQQIAFEVKERYPEHEELSQAVMASGTVIRGFQKW